MVSCRVSILYYVAWVTNTGVTLSHGRGQLYSIYVNGCIQLTDAGIAALSHGQFESHCVISNVEVTK